MAHSAAAPETRRAWLETLVRAELADIALGGIDLAPSAGAAILQSANKEAWQWLEARLAKIFSADSSWAQATMQKFVAQGRKKHGLNV